MVSVLENEEVQHGRKGSLTAGAILKGEAIFSTKYSGSSKPH